MTKDPYISIPNVILHKGVFRNKLACQFLTVNPSWSWAMLCNKESNKRVNNITSTFIVENSFINTRLSIFSPKIRNLNSFSPRRSGWNARNWAFSPQKGWQWRVTMESEGQERGKTTTGGCKLMWCTWSDLRRGRELLQWSRSSLKGKYVSKQLHICTYIYNKNTNLRNELHYLFRQPNWRYHFS